MPPFRIAGSYLAPFDYSDRVERDGLTMTFHSRHRPLADYFAAVAAAGIMVDPVRADCSRRAERVRIETELAVDARRT